MQLKKIRENAGLTQTDLAERANVSQKTISAIEIGRIKNPTYMTLLKLSLVLGCEPEEIMKDETVKPASKPKKVSKLAALKQQLEV